MPSSSRLRGSLGPQRAVTGTPMSERQQMALVMQMTSQANATNAVISNVSHGTPRSRDRNERGETPLHIAAIKGDHEKVKKILDQGTDPNVTDFAENLPSQRGTHGNRARDDNKKSSSTSDETSASCSSSNMETVNKASEDKSDSKETPTTTGAEKNVSSTVSTTSKTEGESNSTNVSTSAAIQEETSGTSTAVKRTFNESESAEGENTEDDASKRKKRKETEPVKEASKTVQNRTNVGRSGLLSGTKPPGPASKTGVAPLSKGGGPLTTSSNKASASSTSQKSASTHSSNQNKTSGGVSTPGKGNTSQSSQSGKSGSGSQGKGNSSNLSVSQVNAKGAADKKSPCASPKAFVHKSEEGDNEDTKVDSGGPKVPPLKIVIPGGVGGAGSSGSQQEGDGSSAQRGSTKNRSNTSTLPYIIHVSDNVDIFEDEKRSSGSDEKSGSSAQRVLRSHRNNDGEREKDRGRSSPHASTPCSPSGAPVPTKTPPPYHSRQSPESSSFDSTAIPSTSGTSGNSNSGSGGNSSSQGAPVVELHPRKRKIKASRDTHQSSSSSSSHQSSNEGNSGESSTTFHPNTNPYQQYLNIRKQVERKQKGLFPVQPKPPQGFKDYLINRCSYVLKNNNKQQPIVNPPQTVPQQMREAFVQQENERHSLRVQHLIEKEKLVLAVEQEILRVHGKAARALANQSLAFSACTLLMDHEVYNVRTPEQEEKESNAQRSRYNGRLFLSWLQEVDDKWEKIKDDMLRRHRIEADSLHATQSLSWEWKMKEFGICDHKTTPSIDLSHVPKVHVSDDFDLLPA